MTPIFSKSVEDIFVRATRALPAALALLFAASVVFGAWQKRATEVKPPPNFELVQSLSAGAEPVATLTQTPPSEIQK